MRRRLLARLHLSEQTQMILLGMATGVAVGYAAVLFILLVEVMQVGFFGEAGKLFEVLGGVPWYRILLVPALGGLAAGLAIRYLAPEARGHGVSEVMEAIALTGGVIRGRVALVKIIASACTLGSGGSVGREGPIVQVGAAIASKLGQIFGANTRQLTTLAGCGSAAGIAAVFNAPIAGAIFALEVILGDFGLATFAPIVLASVMGTVVAQSQLGNYPSFEAPLYQLQSPLFEVPLYVLLGILAGLVSVAFIRGLGDAERRFGGLRIPDPLKTAIGGLMIGLIGLAVPHVMGGGYAVMTATLFDRIPWMLLAALLVMKLLATCITVGSGGSGGTFAPALFLGVTLGGVFGHLAHFLFPAYTAGPGAYALVGMGAVLAGAAHAPLTALLMAFEITNNYQTILPVMIACSISAIIARRYAKDSIYTMKLSKRGINIQAGREVHVLRALRVSDFMNRNVTCVQENMKFGAVLDFVSHSRYSDFPVLDPEGKLVGVVSFNDFREVAFEQGLEDVIVVRDLMTADVVTVSEGDDLHTALQRIGSRDIEQIPVVDSDDPGRVIGMLSRRDILTAYNKALVQLRTPAPPRNDPAPPPPPGA
ncbi:MAG: chloride channel protein [Myxococcota bacterium]